MDENEPKKLKGGVIAVLLTVLMSAASLSANAEDSGAKENIISSPGVLIMLVLVLIPMLAGIGLICLKLARIISKTKTSRIRRETNDLSEALLDEAFYDEAIKRKQALDYSLSNNELAGQRTAGDEKGLLLHVGR
ncbi:hypothetical protein [Mucilaginibacter antarcticus]|uniref:hypothetical protein n=1 Tax=Mucilaginibacter antarcticus TaxID=1855725 RepID=UPI00363A23BD